MGGALRFAGTVSEPATVTIQGKPAVVDATNHFSGTAAVASGTTTVTIAAKDGSGNQTTAAYNVSQTGAGTTLAYDANGNLASDGVRSFTWDAENRLLSITIGTHVSEFTYDGEDRRARIVEKDNGSTTSDTRFVWCALEICEERDSSGSTTTKRFFSEGEQQGTATFFYTRDHVGSIRELVDTTGTLRARYDYDAFGRRTKTSGSGDTDLGYTGHRTHGASGLVMTLYRAYDPTLGRWLSEDPLGLGGGTNLYGYVNGDPIGVMDPLGLSGKTFAVGFVKGAAVGVAFGIVATAVSPAVAAALAIGGTAVGAYGLYRLYNSWGCLSGDQRDEVVGGVIGGVVGGAMAGAMVPRTGGASGPFRRLGDLEPIHKPGMNPLTETQLRQLSDDELMGTVVNPLDGQMLKVREGSNRLLDGNTRVMEMLRRGFHPNTRIPVDELPK